MALKLFHDQISTEECAGRGDRTWDPCMPSGHASDRTTTLGFLPHVMSCVTLLGTLLEYLIISKPWMDRIHMWSDVRYGSKDFLNTIPIPTYGLKVKVTDLDVYS